MATVGGDAKWSGLPGPLVLAVKHERNTVIHGRWYPECSYSHPEDAALMCVPHSADTYAQSGPVCHVARSRYRKWSMEEAWAVSEIEDLADQPDQLANRFYSANGM